MERDELYERARRLVFASPAISAAWSRGDFRSLFRGRGLDFDSLRDYSPGEDARLIDWNATARQGKPYVRAWRDDRSLTLFLVVDHSASMEEGSGECSKLDVAVLSAALLGRAASLRDMPVGGIHFDRDILGSMQPRRGRSTDLAFATLAQPRRQSEGPQAFGLAKAIDASLRMLKRRSLVIILSDWRAPGWRDPLAMLGSRHDVVAVRLRDRLEEGLPRAGSFAAVDAETRLRGNIAASSRKLRREWIEFWARDVERIRRTFADCHVSSLDLDSAEDPAIRFLRFFDARGRKIG